MRQLRPLAQKAHEARFPDFQLIAAQSLHRKLVLGTGNAILNGQILHRLHIQPLSGNLPGPFHETPGDFPRARVTRRQIPQVHRQPRRAQAWVDAIHPHKKSHAFHRRIRHDNGGQLFLAARHGGKGTVPRRFGDALQHPRVLRGEKPLGRHGIEGGGQQQRPRGNGQHKPLPGQNPVQRPRVPAQQRAKTGAVLLAFTMFPAKQHGTEHGRQAQGNNRRNQNGNGQRHGEFPEKASRHIAHEKQRDQHGHQRQRQGNNGKADLPRPPQGGLPWAQPLFKIAGNILDDHDGIVHHETGGDDQRHQGQIIERIPRKVHDAQRTDKRERHGQRGNDGRLRVAQKQPDDRDDKDDGQRQFQKNVVHRGADGRRAIRDGDNLHVAGQAFPQARHERVDAVRHLNDIGAGLALH